MTKPPNPGQLTERPAKKGAPTTDGGNRECEACAVTCKEENATAVREENTAAQGILGGHCQSGIPVDYSRIDLNVSIYFQVWIISVNVWLKCPMNCIFGNVCTEKRVDSLNTYFPHCIY